MIADVVTGKARCAGRRSDLFGGDRSMTTDTSEKGLERLICTVLAGHPCDPPKPQDHSRHMGVGRCGMDRPVQSCRVRPWALP